MKTQYRLILAGMLLLMPAQTLTVYAGSLNGNEQELLGVISGTETYNGQTYRVKEEYIAQARAYFLQDDVDITDEQKQEALQTMYGSIAQGVAEGYLEPVGGSGTAYEGEAVPVLPRTVEKRQRKAGQREKTELRSPRRQNLRPPWRR